MNPSTSQMTTSRDFSYVPTTGPDEKLILCVDPKEKKVMKYDDSALERVADVGALKLWELVTQPCFQDNTLIFEKLLRNRNFVMCVYPPGSGKTTIAKLLNFYLSKNGMPEEIRTWLNTCEFQRMEDIRAQADAMYLRFRSSSPFVLYLDFSQISGEAVESLETSYGECLLRCCKNAGLPDDMARQEESLIRKDPNNIWTSLSRLRSGIRGHFSGNLYIILDSLDNMYNLIANLPISSSKQLYSKFTKDIQGLIDKDDPRIKVFCFGVSPYLITEFQSSMVYSIIDTENVVGKYFSFSDESIGKVIQEWQLDVSVDQVKAVAQFQYNQNMFINPYLCSSYLKSLKDGKPFNVNISLRSLWMSCIFNENDFNILFSLLSGELNCKFNMNVTMGSMCTIPESLKSRELYYPLFIFGGFFSCSIQDDKSYTLFISNDTTGILIRYHLDVLFLNKFKLPAMQSKDIIADFLAKKFSSFCVMLSNAMSQRSSLMSANEMTYHNYIAGIFYHLERMGYHQMENDADIVRIRPDSVYVNNDRAILMEYKTVKLDTKRKRKTNEDVRFRVVTKCEEIARKTCHHQIQEYAPAVSAKYQKNVEINLILFYINHVILLNSEYSFEKCRYSNYRIFSSKGFFLADDLKLIKDVTPKMKKRR